MKGGALRMNRFQPPITVLWLVIAVPFLKHTSGSPLEKSSADTIGVKILVPNQDDPIVVTLPSDSVISSCLQSHDNTTEDENGLTVPGHIFTQCAKSELARLRSALFQNPSTQGTEKEDIKLFDPVDRGYTTLPNTPTFIKDIISILNVTFDLNQVLSDVQRILEGDLIGVIKEYPDRVQTFLQTITELPQRIQDSFKQMDRMKDAAEINNNTAFVEVLQNLQNYLNQASQMVQDIPNIFSIVNVMDTLKSIIVHVNEELETKIKDIAQEGSDLTSNPADVLNDLVKTMESIPQTLTSLLKSPDKVREFDVLRIMDIPRRINKDISTTAMNAVKAASKSVQQLLTMPVGSSRNP